MIATVKVGFILLFFVHCLQAQKRQCDCKPVSDCDTFQGILDQKDFNQLKKHQFCGFDGKVPKYCCPTTAENYLTELNRVCGVYYSSAIVGGIHARPHEYPWMVALVDPNNEDQVICEGVLVSEDIIVTAAYCIVDGLEKVKLGNANLTQAQGFEIKSTLVHPDYNERTFANNLAVIELKDKLIFDSKIRPICLPEIDDLENEDLLAIGWPRPRSTISHEDNSTLIKVWAKSVDRETCQAAYQSTKIQLTSEQICAEGRHKRNGCPGDTGGPLTSLSRNQRHVLNGISSFGSNSGCRFPEVYTNVLHHKDWILDSILN